MPCASNPYKFKYMSDINNEFSPLSSLKNGIDYLGNCALSLLNYRIVNFTLTWVLSRTVIKSKPSESFYLSGSYGAFMGAVSLINDYLKEEGYVDDYSVTYSVLIATYIDPQGIITNPWVNSGFSLLSGFALKKSVDIISENGYTEDLVVLSASSIISYQVYKITQTPLVPSIHHGNLNHLAIVLENNIASSTTYEITQTPLVPSICFVLGLTVGKPVLEFLLPIKEINDAYHMLTSYIEPEVLDEKLMDLTAVCINTQLPLSVIGINYLIHSQHKSNILNQIPRDYSASHFMASGVDFIIYYAIPYMLIRTPGETVSQYHANKFNNFIKSEFKTKLAFIDNNFEIISKSNLTLSEYSNSLSEVVLKIHSIIESKMFSLPKLILFPSIVKNHPKFISKLFPIILLIDGCKSFFISTITFNIEDISRNLQELRTKQNKNRAS